MNSITISYKSHINKRTKGISDISRKKRIDNLINKRESSPLNRGVSHPCVGRICSLNTRKTLNLSKEALVDLLAHLGEWDRGSTSGVILAVVILFKSDVEIYIIASKFSKFCVHIYVSFVYFCLD